MADGVECELPDKSSGRSEEKSKRGRFWPPSADGLSISSWLEVEYRLCWKAMGATNAKDLKAIRLLMPKQRRNNPSIHKLYKS